MIHALIEVVAKGGSLLLGVGPSAEGTLNERQISRLKDIGEWLHVNGEAIYTTRTLPVYQSGSTYFTKGKDKIVYALVTIAENTTAQPIITWKGNVPTKGV